MAVLVLAGVLAGTGCSTGGGSSGSQVTTTGTHGLTTAPPATVASTTSSTAPRATTTTVLPSTSTSPLRGGGTLSSAETRVRNGHIKAMGFIKRVWVEGGTRKLEIDYAEMLTGDAANQAAVADGVIKPGEHIDNDYYIRNENPLPRVFDVSNDVVIFDDTGSTGKPVTWDTFMGYWQGAQSNPPHMRSAPWWIERDGASVVEIRQQYLP